MATDLFGNKFIKEESFEIIYQGGSFKTGEIAIQPLYKELHAVESLVRQSIELLIQSKKLDSSTKEFIIYVEFEKGSLSEKMKVVFKHPGTIAVIASFVIPFLNTTYSHFLDRVDINQEAPFAQEMQQVEQDQQFKNNLKSILNPLNNSGESININNEGKVIININYSQKEEIIKNLDREEKNISLKNGDFEEILIGVIRKIDLDAPGQSYLGFTIEKGPQRIPTAIQGEFHLNDIKEIIGERISVKAVVRYKDDEIKHIEILEHTILDKQEKLDLSPSD